MNDSENVPPDNFRVGDKVVCHVPGSWVDGRTATIEALSVTSSDGIHGHYLKVPGIGVTVVPHYELALFKEDGGAAGDDAKHGVMPQI
jgi:hypothetical protein